MCGIFAVVSRLSGNNEPNDSVWTNFELMQNRGPDKSDIVQVRGCGRFCGCVLWQQGAAATKQPIYDGETLFLFNGDIFSARCDKNISDVDWIFEKFQANEDVISILKEVRGPYSFILLKETTKTLYWGRDSLGRNSLLMGFRDDDFYITSVNEKNVRTNVIEVPPLGVYSTELETKTVKLTLWTDAMNHGDYYREQIGAVNNFFSACGWELEVDDDRTINPEWLQATSSGPSFKFDDVLSDFTITSNVEKLFTFLLDHHEISQTSNEFIGHLSKSVQERVINTPAFCKQCIKMQDICPHARVGVLFSGGVDCTLLAVLADRYVPQHLPIPLLNVAFEKVNAKEVNWNVPDRLSAQEAVQELTQLCPNREWQLIEVNVPRKELIDTLNDHISHLVYPLTSVLDESLGGALWFAARGQESLSPCRVLLVGSGADELLGGYTRHRNAFKRTGTVKTELEMDWQRLPSRNLARDDRVICDHGITSRAPFVEERFAQFISSLEPMQKCYHHLPEGVGDKLLLRLSAFRLGLRDTATRRKRALQFGSRIADSKQNAKDRSMNLN